MSDKVELGEIVYCDLTITHKGHKHKIKKVVYKNEGKPIYKGRLLRELKINEPVKIINIYVISRHGFENKSKEYTEVKRSDETRNKITGAYE
tara:strand:+ start:2118 stop:2393 length:276 start_codon:yes stop_codon:yes gene_type:complete